MTTTPEPNPELSPATGGAASTTADHKLRVLFITEDDPLYVKKFFDVFFDEYPTDELEIVGVTVDEAFHEPIWKTAHRMWNFYGPVDFVRLGSRFAGVKAKRDTIARDAAARGLPVVETTSVNSDEYVARVRDIAPDVIVSVAAPEIFKKPLLDSAKLGCINIHSGRLPVYRGMMPNFWQLVEGEQLATVTIHEMVEQLDAGGIYDTLEVPIIQPAEGGDSLHRMIVVTKQEGARKMIDVLRRVRTGNIAPTPLDMSGKKYFSFPKPADVKRLRQMGHRML